MNGKPKKCPFCGSEDAYLSEQDEVIICPNCLAKGPTDWDAFGEAFAGNTELTPQEMWDRRDANEQAINPKPLVNAYERFKHLDTLFEMIRDPDGTEESDPFHAATRDLWRAIKAAMGIKANVPVGSGSACADDRCPTCRQRNSRAGERKLDDGSVIVWYCNVPGCANAEARASARSVAEGR